MEQLFTAGGTLNHGFVGQIGYTICLEHSYHGLDIAFAFNKRRFSPDEVAPERIAEIQAQCRDQYGLDYTDEQARGIALNTMKTEIHTSATLNGQFIGGIHRQLETRHMTFDGDTATDGCIPQPSFSGVLCVTLLVFNVILDDTAYTLTVSAQ